MTKPADTIEKMKARLEQRDAEVGRLLAGIEKAEAERDAAKAALHDWYCVGCKQRYSAPPDDDASRRSCPACGKWMLFAHEHRAEQQEARIRALSEEIAALRAARKRGAA